MLLILPLMTTKVLTLKPFENFAGSTQVDYVIVDNEQAEVAVIKISQCLPS